jgi:hypothetical protein
VVISSEKSFQNNSTGVKKSKMFHDHKAVEKRSTKSVKKLGPKRDVNMIFFHFCFCHQSFSLHIFGGTFLAAFSMTLKSA